MNLTTGATCFMLGWRRVKVSLRLVKVESALNLVGQNPDPITYYNNRFFFFFFFFFFDPDFVLRQSTLGPSALPMPRSSPGIGGLEVRMDTWAILPTLNKALFSLIVLSIK